MLRRNFLSLLPVGLLNTLRSEKPKLEPYSESWIKYLQNVHAYVNLAEHDEKVLHEMEEYVNEAFNGKIITSKTRHEYRHRLIGFVYTIGADVTKLGLPELQPQNVEANPENLIVVKFINKPNCGVLRILDSEQFETIFDNIEFKQTISKNGFMTFHREIFVWTNLWLVDENVDCKIMYRGKVLAVDNVDTVGGNCVSLKRTKESEVGVRGVNYVKMLNRKNKVWYEKQQKAIKIHQVEHGIAERQKELEAQIQRLEILKKSV